MPIVQQVSSPFPTFTGFDGKPIDGFLYIGEEGKDPEAYPIQVYWDEELTLTASQPISIVAGFATNMGQAAKLFTSESYSVLVKNLKGRVESYSRKGIALIGSPTFLTPGLVRRATDTEVFYGTPASDAFVSPEQFQKFDKVVSTIDEFRLSPGAFDGDSRFLACHTTNGDGGHGTFYWDAASTDADDGQDTIAVTGVSTGRWKRNIDQIQRDVDELPTPSTVVRRDSGGRGAFSPAVSGSHAVVLNQLADLILDRIFMNIDYWLDGRVTGDLTAGWLKLPLGIKVQFGKVLTSGTDATWVTYNYPTPFKTFLGVVLGNGMDPYGGDVRVRTSGLSQFQVWSSGYLNRYVQWIAIGLDKPYQINSAEMGLNGMTLTLTMSREGVIGDDYAEDRWTLTGSVSGSQHPVSHVLTNFPNKIINLYFETPYVAGETLTLSYIYGKNQVYALDDSEPLRGFPEMVVTNSVEDYDDIALWLGFDGTISVPTGYDGTYTATAGEYPPSAVYDIITYNPYPPTGPVFSLDSAVVAAGDKALKMVSSENDQGRWLAFTTAPLTGSGRIGLWYKYGSIFNQALLFRFFNGEFPWSGITVTVDNTYGRIGIKYDVNMGAGDATETSGSVQCDTTALAPWDTNWHYYEFSWDVADFGLKVYKDGVLLNTFAGWGAGMTAALVNGSIGKVYNYLNMHNYHMDNFVVSTDKGRDLYALANRSISPRVG